MDKYKIMVDDLKANLDLVDYAVEGAKRRPKTEPEGVHKHRMKWLGEDYLNIIDSLLEGHIQRKTPLKVLRLSKRASVVLAKASIFYVEDLVGLKESEYGLNSIKGVRNLGAKTLEEIADKLEAYQTKQDFGEDY